MHRFYFHVHYHILSSLEIDCLLKMTHENEVSALLTRLEYPSVEDVKQALTTLGEHLVTDRIDLANMLRLVVRLDSAQSDPTISQEIPNLLMEVWTKYLLLLKRHAHMFDDHSETRELLELILRNLINYAESGLHLLDVNTSQAANMSKVKYLLFICQRISAALSVSQPVAINSSLEGLAFAMLASFRGLSSMPSMDGDFFSTKGEDLLLKSVNPSSKDRLFNLLYRAQVNLVAAEMRTRALAACGLSHCCCLFIEKAEAEEYGESISTAISINLSCLYYLSCAHVGFVEDTVIWSVIRRLTNVLLSLKSPVIVNKVQVFC